MKFTLSWLKDHLETEASLDEIVEALTMIGLEVEEVDDQSQYLPFTIAKVVSARQHPDADRLRVLEVDKGDGKLIQVVCGAPNARQGLIGAFAGPGTYVPGIDVTLSVGNIRGVESHGMMCSERELNLSDEHDGIIDLPSEAPIGASFASHIGLDDPVIEIGISPNRPDALGVCGIARDLEAFGLGRVKPVKIAPVKRIFANPVDVNLEFKGDSLCPAFGLCYVKGVKNGPSPKWMQQRLLAIGMRPISALVDITNYVTFDLGRPLHVFDADKVAGNLVVRRAKESEDFVALDGKTYKLNPENCVIADDAGVESLAGVMGGEASGCSDETVNVLVESALWEPLNIARTGRDLGIITDARYRFERGVDPQFMRPGLDHATNLVIELCGGEASKSIIAGEIPSEKLTIDFPLHEVKRLTGLAMAKDETISILNSLGFETTGNGDTIEVTAPSWRPDIEGKADLVEEVMRIHGINKIKPEPLPSLKTISKKILTIAQLRIQKTQRSLASRGMLEAVTWSFISKTQAEHFGGGDNNLALSNPMSPDMSHMRPSLLPNLISAARRNADRGIADVALFEVSAIFQNDQPSGQKSCAGGIRRGSAGLVGSGRNWQGNAGDVGVYDAKADALAILSTCGMDISKVQIIASGPHWYHPGRCGTIQLGPKLILANFGEIHPLTLKALDVGGPICGFEVWLDNIPPSRKKATKTKPPLQISSLQSVKRDFSFVVDQDIRAAIVERAVAAADKKLISKVQIFDVFEGKSLGEGKKSIAVEVTLQPILQTLNDEEIDAVSAKIISNVAKSTAGTLRT